MRNIYWLASCFSKIKTSNSHFLGNQSGIAGVHIFTYTCFAWAGGTFFPVVLLCCVSFWFWREKGFDLHTHALLRVQYSCGGVLVIWFWRKIVFGVTHILSEQYSCAVVSVFFCYSRKFLRNTLLLHSLLLWRESQFSTVYTLLLYSLDRYSQTE